MGEEIYNSISDLMDEVLKGNIIDDPNDFEKSSGSENTEGLEEMKKRLGWRLGILPDGSTFIREYRNQIRPKTYLEKRFERFGEICDDFNDRTYDFRVKIVFFIERCFIPVFFFGVLTVMANFYIHW